MKKRIKLFILMLTMLSLTVPAGGMAFASSYHDESIYIIESVSSISATAYRSTPTTGKVTASGSLTTAASSITTKATLYEYSTNGSLIATGVAPVTKTIYNCSIYSFNTAFSIQSTKKYKVKLEITDVTNGLTSKKTFYSDVF